MKIANSAVLHFLLEETIDEVRNEYPYEAN